MKPDQNPFSLYDFLGYFIPGATAIFLYRIMNQALIDFNLSNYASRIDIRNSNLVFPFIIASYLIGHLLSIISSYTIEKYAYWSHSYPSVYLLKESKVKWVKKYFGEKKEFTKHELRKRRFLLLILLPMLTINFIFHLFFRFRYSTFKTFAAPTIEHINNKKNKLLSYLGVDTSVYNHDEYLFIYHYVLENNIGHSKKIQNYVALFGFVRCVSLIFNIVSWWLIIINICNAYHTNFLFSIDSHMLVLTLGFMFVSYFFYVAFLKFYKKFAQETLMVFSVIPLNFEKENQYKR